MIEQGEPSDRAARMGLSCVAEAGDPQLAAEVTRQGAGAVWRQLGAGGFGPALAERAERVDLTAFTRALARGQFRFVVPGDEEWPSGLADLEYGGLVQRRGGVPFGLWVRGPGRLDLATPRSVAVVGSRAATAYGETVAGELSLELAERGVCVVSGGAFGIDAAAHRGALAAGADGGGVVGGGTSGSVAPRASVAP